MAQPVQRGAEMNIALRLFALMLLIASVVSGCILPEWRNEGHGGERGAGRGGEYRGEHGGDHGSGRDGDHGEDHR